MGMTPERLGRIMYIVEDVTGCNLLMKKNNSTKIGMSELMAIRIILSKILLREKRIQLVWPLTLNHSFIKSLQALKNEAKHRVKPVKLRQTYEADYDDMPFFDDL